MFNVAGQARAKAQQNYKCSLLQLQAPLAQNPLLVAGFSYKLSIILSFISKVDIPKFVNFFKYDRIFCIINPDIYDVKFGWTLEFGYFDFQDYYNSKWSSKSLGLWEKYLSVESQPIQLNTYQKKDNESLYTRLCLFLKQKWDINQ